MKLGVQNSKKALELRRMGKSYADIAKELKVSRSSVCGWVKNVRLTETEKAALKKNLISKMGRGRLQASMTLRTRKVYKEKLAYDVAEKEFDKNMKDPLFMLGMGLIGVKKGTKAPSVFRCTTSDAVTMKILMKWMEKFLDVPKKHFIFRLFVAISHKNLDFQDYWIKTLGILPGSLRKTVILSHRKSEKDKEYKGSLEVVLPDIEVVRRVIAWQNLTMRYYS